MKKFPLDLSKFKKVASDKDTTKLEHKDGHSITLAHSKLDPKLRGQLKALPMCEGGQPPMPSMAKGGKVSDPSQQHLTYGDKLPNSIEKGVVREDKHRLKMDEGGKVDKGDMVDASEEEMLPPASDSQRMKVEGPNNPKLAESKKVPHYADGTTFVDDAVPASQTVAQDDSIAKSLGSALRGGASDAAGALQSVIDPALKGSGDFIKGLTGMDAAAPATQASSAPALPSGPAPITNPDMAAASQKLAGSIPSAGLATPEASPEQSPLAESQGLIQGAKNDILSGVPAEAAAKAEIAKAQIPAQQKAIEQQQAILDRARAIHQDTEKEMSTVMDEIKQGHINPNHYMDSMSTGQKISSAIGLFLGGFSSGITGQENPALKFINAQIDRDIEAQKANMGNKLNLVGAMSKYLGDVDQGSQAAGLMLKNVTLDKMALEANKLADPLLKAQALQRVGDEKLKIAPQLQNISMTNAAIQASKNGGEEAMLPIMRIINPERAKEIESRLIPGVGVAKVPVTAEVRDSVIAKNTLDKQARDLYDWASKHSGSLSPSDIAEGRTKAAEIQSLYRNAIHGGVFKKGEQDFIDNIVDSDPAKFFNSIRVLPKLKEVITSNDKQLNILKGNYGLPTKQAPSVGQQPMSDQDRMMLNLARANPSHPNAKLIFKKLGVQE